jgi:hypothetical protein
MDSRLGLIRLGSWSPGSTETGQDQSPAVARIILTPGTPQVQAGQIRPASSSFSITPGTPIVRVRALDHEWEPFYAPVYEWGEQSLNVLPSEELVIDDGGDITVRAVDSQNLSIWDASEEGFWGVEKLFDEEFQNLEEYSEWDPDLPAEEFEIDDGGIVSAMALGGALGCLTAPEASYPIAVLPVLRWVAGGHCAISWTATYKPKDIVEVWSTWAYSRTFWKSPAQNAEWLPIGTSAASWKEQKFWLGEGEGGAGWTAVHLTVGYWRGEGQGFLRVLDSGVIYKSTPHWRAVGYTNVRWLVQQGRPTTCFTGDGIILTGVCLKGNYARR